MRDVGAAQRFAANDRAADEAAGVAEMACGDADAVFTAGVGLPGFDTDDLPFCPLGSRPGRHGGPGRPTR